MSRNEETLDIICRYDNGDGYSMHGVLLCKDRDTGTYLLGQISHCSCFGTWDDGGFSGTWLWEGNKKELLHLAKKSLDPIIPGRKLDRADYDYKFLRDTYKEVLRLHKEGTLL